MIAHASHFELWHDASLRQGLTLYMDGKGEGVTAKKRKKDAKIEKKSRFNESACRAQCWLINLCMTGNQFTLPL